MKENPRGWIHALPNQLTLGRIAGVPLVLILYPLGFDFTQKLSAIIFALASLTDWLDGFIARAFKVESRLGATLDPIADKMLMTAGILLIASEGRIWVWLAGLLLIREIAINGLRLVALEQGVTIAVDRMGKWKTAILDVGIFCLMWGDPLYGWPTREIGTVSLWISLFLSYYSAYIYIKSFWAKFEI